MKRLGDLILSALGLVVAGPVIIIFMYLVWLHDKKSPLYIGYRVGKDGIPFKMIKLRSMTIDADKSGVDSTSDNDCRITAVGKIIRKYKLDELTQLYNVIVGEMSFVGPRPNVNREVEIYTEVEKRLLTVKPGITDFASIVFADEGKILKGSSDPDLLYNQLIRPWKSRLGLIYVDNSGFLVDLIIICATAVSLFNRKIALRVIVQVLSFCGASDEVISTASRTQDLVAVPPPGADAIVVVR